MATPKSKVPGEKTQATGKTFTLKCPTCKQKVVTTIPLNIKEMGQGGLVNVLIPDTMTDCGHSLQVFIDHQFRIRGYTRIDFVNRESEMKVLGTVASPTFFKESSVEEEKQNKKIGRDKMGEAIKKFTTNMAQVKAVACFQTDGTIFAKALTEDIDLEDISLVAAAMIAQSTQIGVNLKLKLKDFTITSDTDKITVFKAGEVLVIILYDKSIKEGLMKLELRKLETQLKTLSEEYITG